MLRQKVPQKAAHEKKEHGLRVNLSKDQPANLPSSAGTDAREIESAKLEHRADSIYSAARDYHLEHKLFQAEKAYLQAAEVYIQARKLLENMADRRRIEEKTDKALRGAEKLKSKHSVDGEVCASLPQPPKPKAATPAKSVQFKQSVPSEKPSLVPAHVVRDGHGLFRPTVTRSPKKYPYLSLIYVPQPQLLSLFERVFNSLVAFIGHPYSGITSCILRFNTFREASAIQSQQM